MRIEKQALAAVASQLAGIPQSRSTLPILAMTRLEAIGGRLKAISTDLEAHLVAQADCEGDLAPCCVSTKLLMQLAQTEAETIELTFEEGKLRCVYGSNRLDMATLPAKAFPEIPINEGVAIGVATHDLAEGVEAVAWAAESKTHDLKHSLVFCELTDKLLTIASCNGKAFACFRKALISAPVTFMFPATYARGLTSALLSEGANLILGPSWLTVQTTQGSFSVRLVEGGYFPIARLFAQEGTFLGFLDQQPCLDTLSVLPGLVAESFAPVDLAFSPTGLAVKFSGPPHAYESVVPGKFEVGDCKLDGLLLKQVLNHLEGDHLEVKLLPNALTIVSGDLTVAVAVLGNPRFAPKSSQP